MKKLLILTLAVVCNSCWLDPFRSDRDGKFLGDVVPLEEFNSEFDDYNSDMPYNKSGQTQLTFSSKRDKKNFLNLVTFPASFSYDKKLALKKMSTGPYSSYYEKVGPVDPFVARANGNFNVFGPKSLSLRYDLGNYDSSDFLFFFADDSEGNMEIKYLTNNEKGIQGPFKFDLLNSTKDDGYPSFSMNGKIYFSSNRDGNFDIYELSIPIADNEFFTTEKLLKPAKYTLRKVEELSSPADDKCPYFDDDVMVFVSDRPGGMGGTDIYYSKLENGKWSTPVNAGDRVNTSFNEYRPILPTPDQFNYHLMIFSSDRPGGKGGFDLYMTGLFKKW